MILSTGVGLLLTIFEQSKQSLSQASLLLQENIVHQQLRVDLREAQIVAQDGEQITITSRDQSTIIWSADANRLYRQAASGTTKSNRPIVLQLPQGCKIRFQLVMSEIPKSAALTLFVDGNTNTAVVHLILRQRLDGPPMNNDHQQFNNPVDRSISTIKSRQFVDRRVTETTSTQHEPVGRMGATSGRSILAQRRQAARKSRGIVIVLAVVLLAIVSFLTLKTLELQQKKSSILTQRLQQLQADDLLEFGAMYAKDQLAAGQELPSELTWSADPNGGMNAARFRFAISRQNNRRSVMVEVTYETSSTQSIIRQRTINVQN